MVGSVLTKTLRDQRRSLPTWVLAVLALEAMYISFWPSMAGQPSLDSMMEQMPEALRALFATSNWDLTSPEGYVQVEMLSFMGPILFIIYTVGAGAAAVAGEEDRGTLDLLLAQPLSRGRLVLGTLGAMVVGTAALGAAGALALLAAGPVFDLTIPADKVLAAMVHLTLLGLVFGAVALAVGAATGRPGLAKGVSAGLAVLAYVVNGLGPMVDWLEPLQPFSPFYQYIAHDPLRTGIAGGGALIAVATVVVLTAVAMATFRRRDVAA